MWSMFLQKYTLPAIATAICGRGITLTCIDSVSKDICNHVIEYQTEEQKTLIHKYKHFLSKNCKPHYINGLNKIDNYDAIANIYEIKKTYHSPLTPMQRRKVRDKLHDILYGFQWGYDERMYIKSIFHEYHL